MLILLDSNFLLHRILKTPDFFELQYAGQYTGGVFGFTQSLYNIISVSNCITPGVGRIISIWDGKKSDRRKQLNAEYKANREPKTEEERLISKEYFDRFNAQRKIIQNKLLPYLGCLSITHPTKEADDVIYQICEMFPDEFILVITEDKDLFQLLIHFNNINVYRPIQKVLLKRENFKEIVGFPYQCYLVYKALLGDPSDNLKGVPGVGKVNAAKAANQINIEDPYKSLISLVYEASKSDEKGLGKLKSIYNNLGVVANNIEIMDCSREIFLNSEKIQIKQSIDNFKPIHFKDQFHSLCQELAFNSILKDFEFWFSTFTKMYG